MMLHAIASELNTALADKGVPFPVYYSDAPQANGISWRRIILDEDMDGGDSFKPQACMNRNPKSPGTLACGVVFRVWAESNVHGAMGHNHRELARQVVDMLLVAIDQVCRGRVQPWSWKSGKFLKPEQIDPSLQGMRPFSGAVYEIRGSIDRGVFDKTWVGEATPTVEVGPDGMIIRQNKLVVESDPDEIYER
jgi:hypothetical protein